MSFFPPPRTSRIIPLAGGLGQSGITPGPRVQPCHRSLPPRSHPCPCGERQVRAKPSLSACPPSPSPTAQPDLPLPPTLEHRSGEERGSPGGDPGPGTCQIPSAGRARRALLALSLTASRWRCGSHASSRGSGVRPPGSSSLTRFALWMQNT